MWTRRESVDGAAKCGRWWVRRTLPEWRMCLHRLDDREREEREIEGERETKGGRRK